MAAVRESTSIQAKNSGSLSASFCLNGTFAAQNWHSKLLIDASYVILEHQIKNLRRSDPA